MVDNKNHWYDGKFYDRFIAPNQDRLFSSIKSWVEPDSTLLDIGCGTGRLAIQLADHCKFIKGVDLSEKNIVVAKGKLKEKHNNIEFVHGNALRLNDGKQYNFAILTYVIHEMNPDDRVQLLLGLKKVAERIIIGEYIVPHQKGFWGAINFVVEFFAGSEHFRNFKHFINNGGVEFLAKEAGFSVEKKILNNPKSSYILQLKAIT